MSSSLSVVRQPLVDIVIERLRHLIAGKTWPVGMKIPNEAELSNLFDVGRNTIREAIRVLSHSGMLEVRQETGPMFAVKLILPKLCAVSACQD